VREHRQEFVLGAIGPRHLHHSRRESFLEPAALGDVADDFRRPDDFAVAVKDGRNRQGHIELRPVLAQADGFVLFDPPLAPNAFRRRSSFSTDAVGMSIETCLPIISSAV
jgi:hypothetical protein